MDKNKLLIVNLIVFMLGLSLLGYKHHLNNQEKPAPIVEQPVTPIQPQPEIQRPNPNISVKIPPYLNYDRTVEQLKKWNAEAPKLTSVGTYGKSRRGKDLWYIRIHGDDGKDDVKPVMLVTACIHGNEPLSASTTMGYIGTMLDAYGEDEEVTRLIDTRDFYFIPVVSPDSYPHSRYVDGVDPNRNFPTDRDPNKRSVAPVQALREFFLKIKPDAVISGHTWGRVYLIPHGDKMQNCANYNDYKPIMDKMKELSRYRWIRACDMYKANGGLNNPPIRVWGLESNTRPIYGTEVDWYYKNGAASIVMEFGTHQRVPSTSDIQVEFQRTYKAVLHYFDKAPLIDVR